MKDFEDKGKNLGHMSKDQMINLSVGILIGLLMVYTKDPLTGWAVKYLVPMVPQLKKNFLVFAFCFWAAIFIAYFLLAFFIAKFFKKFQQ